MQDFWVFGYGSLMWNPGFEYVDRQIATLRGYDRSFCMRSIHHRGTVADPGLVLALDPAPHGACSGLAFHVQAARADATLAYLRERELISSAYVEETVDLSLLDGRDVRALVYVIDVDHEQYCGGLPLEEQAQIIAHAVGGRGPNSEYLNNTALHLRDLGLEDADLTWLARRVREIQGG